MASTAMQQPDIEFLTTKDLQVLEQARLSGDLKALKQHVWVLERALPSLTTSRRHEADKMANKRLPYLRQVMHPQ